MHARRMPLALALLLGIASQAAAQPSLISLGHLPGVEPATVPTAISADGTTVVGNLSDGPMTRTAFRFTEALGLQPLPSLPGFPNATHASDVSGDGSVVVGENPPLTWPLPIEGVVWIDGGAPIPIGDLRGGLYMSRPTAVSRDGTTVVGSGANATDFEAVRWTADGGLVGLGTLPGHEDSGAADVSADGSVAVGGSSPPGSPSAAEAVRWTAGAPGPESIAGGIPFAAERSVAIAVSGDGGFILGVARTRKTGSVDDRPVRWTPWSGPRALLDRNEDSFDALAMSDDGRVVVGDDFGNAVIWDAHHGMRDLRTVLEEDYGLDTSPWCAMFSAVDLSADGLSIVGTGSCSGAWLVRLPAACADGLDNDADGHVDLGDADCESGADNVEAPDSDGDWWLDAEDNCPTLANADQLDADENGFGNTCEHLRPVHRVPGDFATVQAAIDAAQDGDRVVVDPGTYHESIDFRGKLVALESRDGPAVTTLVGSPVANFESNETTAAVLRGFTLRSSGFDLVHVRFAGATIDGNVIEGAHGVRAAIDVSFSRVVIRGNEIRGQEATASRGGAIFLFGTQTHAEIVDNLISGNRAREGAGIWAQDVGALAIRGNRILGNVATEEGGGIYARSATTPEIVQNLIAQNEALVGGGIDAFPARIVQNTIVDNTASAGAALRASADLVLVNNVVTASESSAIECFAGSTPAARGNLVWSQAAPAWSSACDDPTGTDGNLSADPRFVDPDAGNYRVVKASPIVDAGSADAPGVGAVDLAGATRVADGNGDGVAVIDIGVFERAAPASCGLGFEIAIPLIWLGARRRRSASRR
jgi:uncharacterized membrane protein